MADNEIGLAGYKINFIKMLIGSGALKVGGSFLLKSKRVSPYFINVGGFNSGSDTLGLASAYADTIAERLNGKFDLVYGIPEKGVSLAPTVSAELSRLHNIESNWFFTRKVGKTYGEATNLSKEDIAKSMIVGKIAATGSRIILLDDVLTTGEAKYQAIDELNRLLDKPNMVGLVIAVDRQEVDTDGNNAIKEFTSATDIPVYSILKATEIYEYLISNNFESVFEESSIKDMGAYLKLYGTEEAKDNKYIKILESKA